MHVSHDHQSGGEIYRDGLTQVLEAPEFVESASMRKIVRVFEHRSLLDQIIGDYLVDGDVHVVIAGDGRYDDLADISLVIGSYGVSERAVGVVGVMGPLRMAYGRNISVVRFVAGQLGCAPSRVRLTGGMTSRSKLLEISDIGPEQVAARLHPAGE